MKRSGGKGERKNDSNEKGGKTKKSEREEKEEFFLSVVKRRVQTKSFFDFCGGETLFGLVLKSDRG